MKKYTRSFITALLVLTFTAALLCLAGCGKSKDSSSNGRNTVSMSVSTEETYITAESETATTTAKSTTAKKSKKTTTATTKATTTKKSKKTTTTTSKTTTAPIETFTEYDDSSYVEYHFRNKKLLNEHFEKHGGEFADDFGYNTAAEYEKGASDVINNSQALHKTEAEDGDGVYYIEATNEFVVLSTDGYIRTYFRPSSGKKYYDKQ